MDKKSKPVSLAMRWERAQHLRQSNDETGAARELAALLERDPERGKAWQALAELYKARGLEHAADEYFANARILSSSPSDSRLAQAHHLLAQGQAEQALSLVQTALAEGQGSQLGAVLQVRAAWQAGQFQNRQQLEQIKSMCQAALCYWPLCVQFHIIIAQCLTILGEHEAAVEHIRLACTLDPNDEIKKRWQIADGGRRTADSRQRTADMGSFDEPSVSSHSKDITTSNQTVESFTAGEDVSASPPAEEPASPTSPDLHSEIQKLESDQPHNPASDAVILMRETFDQLVRTLDARPTRPKQRKPFHAIISAREPLARVCGSRSTVVECAMADLATAITRCDGVASEALFIDDAASLAPFGLGPVEPDDATSVKRLLDGLDDVLDMRGYQLISILIVGGDEVIPFHRLPNPTDDPDADVPTDVPYACRNDGELIHDRLVGRMPSCCPATADGDFQIEPGHNSVADILLLQLGAAWQARADAAKSNAKSAGALVRWLMGRKTDGEQVRSFGYAASVWRKAAQEVFNVIGPTQALRLSPPLGTKDANTLLAQVRPQLAYFNLHGLPDSPHWYGQRDPEFVADYSPFPIALSPADISRPANVVFTAACYGAHLFGRDASTSIALRSMQCGTLALVGSTTVAYGGLGKPLVGVDLLGQLFWQYIVQGYSAGEALRQAKIAFVNQMQSRQGYLDGEDQKTLSSFILLGDPTLAPLAATAKATQPVLEHQAVSHAPVLCDKGVCRYARVEVPDEQMQQVKQMVAHALPEMAHAAIQNSEFKAKSLAFKVVSLSKTVPYGDRRGVQLVRVTLNSSGKIVKLAMSK